MNAPIDIVISLIDAKVKSTQKEYDSYPDNSKEARWKVQARLEAYQELIKEFEGFKKLFN